VSPSSSTGATPDGHGTWTLKVDTISGGDPKVADAFNKAVQASVREQGEQFNGAQSNPDPDPTRPWNFETTPQIYFSGASVSELLEGVYYAQNAAHPNDTVSTVVIDSRSATPITLKDLFTNEQAGLDRLSQQTKQLFPVVTTGTGPTPMADAPGNAPVEANFANWIPTPQGLEIHFADYQLAHGLPVLSIPWSALDDLLAPGMTALRQP